MRTHGTMKITEPITAEKARKMTQGREDIKLIDTEISAQEIKLEINT